MEENFTERRKNMGRYELKYYISRSTAAALKSVLGALLQKDMHGDEDGSYTVTSTYFDDGALSSYYDKDAGNDYRDRWRIRSYNGSEEFINLERKSKKGDTSVKTGKRIPCTTAREIMLNGTRNLPLQQNGLLSDFFSDISQKKLIPRLTVEYKRTAFAPSVSDVRITVDEDLRACAYREPFDTETPKILLPMDDLVILEVKYTAAMPDYLRSVLSRFPMDRCSISKYALSVERLLL